MTTINLYQDQPKKQKSISQRIIGSGLFFSMSLLVIVILVFIGLKIFVYFLDGQNENLMDVIQKEKTSLTGIGNLEQVVDTQTRLKEIKDNLQIKNNQVSRTQMIQVLGYMEAEINNGIVVSSYMYENDKNKVTLKFDANNFNDAAQQILGLKDSDHFTNVNLLKINRGEKAISCEVEMNVKS